MKVFKPKSVCPGRLSGRGNHDDVYLGSRSPRDPEDIPLGKVALSFRFKKGRRKLVKGVIRAVPYDSIHFGLQWEHLFTPSNNHQRDKLYSLMPELKS